MSKEIKMSDMFDLPLVGSESPFVRDSSGNCVIYAQSKLNDISELERTSRAKHAVHAINNHDRLTEENALMKQQLSAITAQRDELLQALESSNDLNARLIGQHNKVNPALGFL